MSPWVAGHGPWTWSWLDEFGGKRNQVPLNEVDKRNAIHGLVRWASWSVREREAYREKVLAADQKGPSAIRRREGASRCWLSPGP